MTIPSLVPPPTSLPPEITKMPVPRPVVPARCARGHRRQGRAPALHQHARLGPRVVVQRVHEQVLIVQAECDRRQATGPPVKAFSSSAYTAVMSGFTW